MRKIARYMTKQVAFLRAVNVGLLLASSTAALAEDKLIKLDTRPGVSVSFYYMKRDGAPATVVLLPGGGGGIGLKDGVPTSDNFLVRSRDLFAAHGFNVAVVSRPTDKELDYEFRVSPAHIEDLRQVVEYLKTDAGLPIWLVGTSRGTVSAAAAAIAFGNEKLAGLALTSSVTSNKRTGAVPEQKLEAIRIPVLVLHHEKDACAVTVPGDVPRIMSRLKNTPVKKLIMVDGGANAAGDPCENQHWHGYIGMEQEAVSIIANWIKNPKP
jgi:pimeloyl-ACP methyl ester carboxylesterase